MSEDEKSMVRIRWYDAKFCPGTHNEDAIQEHKMAIFESLGYLIHSDEITTIIAAERNDQNEYRDITLIPTGSIISTNSLH